MKKILLLAFIAGVSLAGCKKDNSSIPVSKNLPSQIVVNLPSSISSDQATSQRAQSDTIKGGEIYNSLRVYIKIGERAADVIQQIIIALRANNVDKPMTFTFVSNDDQRTKTCVVTANASFNSKTYELKLNMTDGTDTAMQIFWNTNPMEGLAILDAYQIDHTALKTNIRYQVEFGTTAPGYDKYMVVSIAGLPVTGIYDLNNLKLFAGLKGNIVEVYGNSNHPNAMFVDTTTMGFDYAFTGRADTVKNIGVVNLGLPATTLNATDSVFTTYSIYNLLSTKYHQVWGPYANTPAKKHWLDSTINSLLITAQIPAYFKNSGFIGCGATLPAGLGFTSDFVNIKSLKPYVPLDIKNLKITFVK